MQTHPAVRTLAILLAILCAYEPIAAQQTVNISINAPVTVDTYTQIVPNPKIVTTVSVNVNTQPITLKPVPPNAPIQLTSQGGTNGNCATPIPASAIIQDCVLGHSAFESNLVNLWLGIHGLPASYASIIYQNGGIELRNELRSFMFAYLAGVIQEGPSLRTPNDQALFDWFQKAVQSNEIGYYNAATQEYYNWFTSPCTFRLNPTVASSFGLSYDGGGYCGASIQSTFTPLPAPDVSYFKEVGQLVGYDNKVAAYDGTITNAAVTGAKITLAAEQNTGMWASVGGLGVSIAAGGIAGLSAAAGIKSITPFTFRTYALKGDSAEAEAEEAVEEETEEAAEDVADEVEGLGTSFADVAAVAGFVLIAIQIGIEAAINLAQSIQNQNAINDMINAGKAAANTLPDLNSMLQDETGYQKIFETFIETTLPDLIQTQGAPAPPPIPSPTPANYAFYVIDHTQGNQSVAPSFNYTTWDPAYAGYPGNAPYPQYGTSFNVYPVESGFVQTIAQGATNYTFFSPTIKYIDPNTGIRYVAELIDKGRFLVTKAPDDLGVQDYDCPADPVTGLTQSPQTQIPSQCKSFIMNTLNIYAFDFYNTTVQIGQPPAFATANAADFSTAGGNSVVPQIDSTTQGLPCSIRTTGTLPPGFVYQDGTFYLQAPFLAVPGTYQFDFVADCETVGLNTSFVNYSYGEAMTTQSFTANVYSAPSPAGSVSGSNTQLSSRASKMSTASGGAAVSTTTGLQFIFPTSSTNLTFTQGQSTSMTVVTNGGPGTTITAGANALPPGMTLTDNGDGTATVNGIPTIPAQSCSSGCAITASASGLNASLTLNDTVAAPVLPTIPTTQSVAWNAAESNGSVIDGSADVNGNPTNVPLSWSVVGALPSWASFTDNANNIATISGTPPVSAVGQTIPIQFQYSYGGTPGFTSPTFALNVVVNPQAPVLRVSPSLLFQVGVPGSGTINSSNFSGATGSSGTWQVNASLPTGLTATPNGTSLTISGTPVNPGDLRIPIQFTDRNGTSLTRNVAMMITQPASLANFPSRLVLFVGVPANVILPVTAGFPTNPAGTPGDGLPSTTGTNLALNGSYSTTNGFKIFANGAALIFGGTPLAAATYPLTVSAQTVLSTGPVGGPVSQPFTIYVQPAGDVNLDGAVDCGDYDLIKSHYGAVIGQPNYLDLADPNRDGVVNILDLAFVQSHLPKGTVCH